MLRARDAMDRDYALPLDVAELAAVACVSRGALHPQRSRRRSARHRTATSSVAASSERCTSCARPTAPSPTSAWRSGSRASGTFSRTFTRHRRRDHRRSSATADRCRVCRRASSRRGRDRAVSEKRPDRARPYDQRHVTDASAVPSSFVLDQDEALDFYVNKLGLEVATDRRPRVHALAHGARPRRPGPRDPARAARARRSMDDATAAQVRGARHQGRGGRRAVPHHRRRPRHLRDR